MRMTPPALIVLLAILCLACSSVRTSYDFDPETDFASWQSYAWYPNEAPPSGNPRLDNPLLHDRITAAVDARLAARGYQKVEEGTPDFYANYHLSTEQRLDVRTIDRGYAGGPHGRRWGGAGWGGVGWTETRVDQYDEGTLVIDFLNASARRVAWRGSGTRRLSRNPSPERVTTIVDQAVEEILSQFPPEPR